MKKTTYLFMAMALLGILLISACTPRPCQVTSWSPDTSTVCSGTTFTQRSNCGHTTNSVGTKDCSTSCTKTEPTTLEGYKTMCNWELYNGQLYKCEVVSNRLEIAWNVPKQGEMEEDIQVWHKSDWLNTISNMNPIKARTRNELDIYSIQVEYEHPQPMTATFYYFCNTNNYCLLYGDTQIEDKYSEEFLCK